MSLIEREYFEIEPNQTKNEKEDNTNKIKENDSEVNIRKDEAQHKNKGSFEEFIESEKKRKEKKKKSNI